MGSWKPEPGSEHMEKPDPEGAEEGHDPLAVLVASPQRGHSKNVDVVWHPSAAAALAEEQETRAESQVPPCSLLRALPNPTALFLSPAICVGTSESA